MSKIKQSTFSQIGNLAFYDGWSPDYIYFNTLYKADIKFDDNNTWDPELAGPVAQEAINAAKTHKFIKNNSMEDSNRYFEERFTGDQGIITILEKAYKYEYNNEKRWINEKIREIKLNTKEYYDDLPAIKQLLDMISKIDQGIDYGALIVIINTILQGIKATSTITKHEEKRIKEMQSTLTRLIKSRRNQTIGVVGHYYNDDIIKQEKSAVKSAKKLWNNISTEYLISQGNLSNTHTVTTQDKFGQEVIKTKYNIFGGKQFSKIQGTIDNILEKWAQTTIKLILQNPQTLQFIVQEVRKNINITGEISTATLEQNIRNIIVVAILQYGIDNLSTILDNALNDAVITEIENDLITNHKLFDIIAHINMDTSNLSQEDFGYQISEPALLTATQDFTELYNNSASKLYDTVNNALELMSEEELNKSTLKKILDNPMSSKRDWTRTQQIIELIHEIEKLQTEMNNLQEEYKQTRQKIIKKIHLPQNTKKAITISIIHGEVKIEQSQLIKAIQGTEAFKYMDFKSFSPSTLTSTITTLKQKAQNNLKNDIINSIKSGMYNINPNELITELRAELQKVQVNIKGVSINKLLQNLRFSKNGTTLVAESKASNNNFITIQFEYQDLITSLQKKIQYQKSKTLKKQQLNIATRYAQAQQDFYREFQAQIDQTIGRLQQKNESPYEGLIPKLLKSSNDWNKKIRPISSRLDKYGEKYIDLIQGYFPSNEDRDKLVSNYITNFINRSLYVSNIVSSADTYVNQIGFMSDRLGANLTEQLSSIASIFKSAGLTLSTEELNWMQFAILNCFDNSIVGTENKNIIESYLGSLMAFALFDEGGAELEYIYKKYIKGLNKKTTLHAPAILHLYQVDNLYVPGSVVLKRTLDTLKQQVLPAIQKQIPNIIYRGTGIRIINNINESIIPNRPIKNYKYLSPINDAWSITGHKAMSQVKIKILFLAGLLDIVKSINKTIGNLQFPQ